MVFYVFDLVLKINLEIHLVKMGGNDFWASLTY